jgi:DNA-binding transcriptional regulator YiaG
MGKNKKIKKEKTEKTEDTRRDRIMTLLTDGRLTQSEAAELLGVSRQRIHQWTVKAGVHPALARARHLKELLHGNHSEAMQL